MSQWRPSVTNTKLYIGRQVSKHYNDWMCIQAYGWIYYVIYTIILHDSVCLSACLPACLSVCLSVGVRKRQVAIIARSSREMSLTDRSRVRVSVRPSNFVYAKNFKILREIGWLARVVYFNDPATGYECQRSGPSRLGADE